MEIKSLEACYGRDLYGWLVCEHCETPVKLVGGYDDNHWHDNVLPAYHCKTCGKNRAGELKTEETTARNVANGVNGV